jgi:RecA-family ATPase
VELEREHARLVEAIRAQAGGPVAAVVLDTLNRSFTGSESSDEAMTAYVKACDAVREALGCAVIIVHHSGLAEGRARGHTALLGSADAQIVNRLASGPPDRRAKRAQTQSR